MTWQLIVGGLIQLFGPLIKKWVADLLDRVARKFGTPPSGQAEDVHRLFEAANSELWWFQFARRRALAAYREVAMSKVVGGAGVDALHHATLDAGDRVFLAMHTDGTE